MEDSLFVGEEDTYYGDDDVGQAHIQTHGKAHGDTHEQTHEQDRETHGQTHAIELNPEATLTCRLPYQRQIVQSMLAQDALLILGRGLGALSITVSLLHALDIAGCVDERSLDSKPSLVILLGARDAENTQFQEALSQVQALDTGHASARGLTTINTEQAATVAKRMSLYSKGGIFSVTSRILIVDLLSKALDPRAITGIIVVNAERVSEYSCEAFILRVYRRENASGFIKALSQQPETFATGFSPLASRLRFLCLSKALLWPRFHVEIAASLNNPRDHGRAQTRVVELQVQLPMRMLQLHMFTVSCIEACVSEIRRSVPHMDLSDIWTGLDTQHRTLRPNFDVLVRQQLEPEWHRVSSRTKQMALDLSRLRVILGEILVCDSVALCKALDTEAAAAVSASSDVRSQWMMSDPGESIFALARDRLGTESEPVIEELPKWDQLAQILHEIDKERYFEHGPVLILCSENRTCRQLAEYLELVRLGNDDENNHNNVNNVNNVITPGQRLLRRKLNEFNLWKEHVAQIRRLFQTGTDQAQPQARNHASNKRAPPNKRRRVRGSQRFVNPDRNGGHVDAESPAKNECEHSNLEQEEENPSNPSEQFENKETKPVDPHLTQGIILLHSYTNACKENLLDEVRPSVVIMYEPEPEFVRHVEVYCASSDPGESPPQVYFMYYGLSLEEEQYLAAVRREKDAFTRIIREKASMPISLRLDSATTESDGLLHTINTRIAGGSDKAYSVTGKSKVVVDHREFRSSLPALLDKSGCELVPVTLIVGDYVISPEICIERKSVSDLIGSLRDGRLFTQCEAMFRFYKSPALLIEFDKDKSFSMEPFGEPLVPGTPSLEISSSLQQSLQAKIVLLLHHFPRLRIIWSSSPNQTAAIITDLKQRLPEPDPDTAVSYGADPHTKDQLYNHTSIDMLRMVPGIDAKNLPLVIRQVPSFRAFCGLSEVRLAAIIGREAAHKAHQFVSLSAIRST